MSTRFHFTQASEVLHAILTGKLPADNQMDRYFRAHPDMGMRDRGFVAETVYGCLRQKRVLEYIAGGSPNPSDLVAAYLLTQGSSARVLEDAGYQGDARALSERKRTLDKTALSFGEQTNLPDWLADKLRAQWGDAETLLLAETLNRPAPVDLRINTIKAERAQVQAQLAAEGFPMEPTPYSPVGLRRDDRAPLFRTKCFKDGLFEVQDEGSQLLSFLLEPKRHEMVVDFCAGAGGKTLHLGALMANAGTVYALDISARRLDKLKPRLRRAGLSNVRMIAISHERDARVQRLRGKIDRVLVDAPCSGTGTLRRNPDIKWREIDLAALAEVQQRILAAAAELVKPGGRVVYATCSLLREENDDVVEKFLSANSEFTALPAAEILARRHIPITATDAALRLYPHKHRTDGFYAVALERKTKETSL
jgi:16S rRNA (cytosine967-C5)-methyltransferase